MAEAGFDIPLEVRPQRRGPDGTNEVSGDIAFELAPVDEIASRGYESGRKVTETDSASDDGPISSDPLSQWIQSLSPAEQTQYSEADMGPTDGPLTTAASPDGGELSLPATGCNAVATQARVGDTEDYLKLLAMFNEINISIISSTDSNQRYVDAMRRWVECASQRGLTVSDPLELTGSVEQAVIDRACRDEVGLASARRSARLESANERRDQIGELLADTRQIDETGS
jgi:hypothetical protein